MLFGLMKREWRCMCERLKPHGKGQEGRNARRVMNFEVKGDEKRGVPL